MRDVSELLRQAVPETRSVDIEAIRARAGQRRRRRRAGMATVVACAVAMVAGVLLRPEHRQQSSQITTVPDDPRVSSSTQKAPAVEPQRMQLDATRVASSANGSLWALVNDRSGGRAVERL